MPTSRDDRIAPTAHYTAYVWHRLRLPHAEPFSTARGRRLFWAFRLAGEWLAAASRTIPSMVQYLELRHRSIEWALEREAPDRIVELGAGLSRRGVTWAVDRGVDYVEIDLAPMIAEKRRLLRRAGSPLIEEAVRLGRLKLVVADALSEAFADELARHLAGVERPAVVAEGLLGYFGFEERQAIARAVASALGASGGGLFVCDLRAREGGAPLRAARKVLGAAIRVATAGRGAREDFENESEIRAFFTRAGFDAIEVVDPSLFPSLGHLRTPVSVFVCRVAGSDAQ